MSRNGVISAAIEGSSSSSLSPSTSSSFLFTSPFLLSSSEEARTSRLSDEIFASPSTSWEENYSDSTSTSSGSAAVTTILDTVGYALRIIVNGTSSTELERGVGVTISTFSGSSGEVSSDLDIITTFIPSSGSVGDDAGGNVSDSLTTGSFAVNSSQATFPGKNVIIPLYIIIFILSFLGNLMVILTLARNRRMRTVTNVLLLNLAISDLLLGVFCMPVTLIGQLLRNFIFGATMCRLLPYFQAVFVSCGVWTLVAISLERYFAICRPLQSRKWQTRSHAYKMILAVWLFTLTWNLPITFVSTLQPIRNSGRFKCREIWPNEETEKIFNLVLDFLLLVIPLGLMILAYACIVSKLWKGLQSEIHHTRSFRQHGPHGHLIPREDSLELSVHSHYSTCKVTTNDGPIPPGGGGPRPANPNRDGVANEIVTLKGGKGVVVRWRRKNAIEVADTSSTAATGSTNSHSHRINRNQSSERHHHHHLHCNSSNSHHQSLHKQNGHSSSLRQTQQQQQPIHNHHGPHQSSSQQQQQQIQHQSTNMAQAIRSTYTGKSMESKKKVIRMLFVLVAEFFVCWTPLYVMNTWYLFDSEGVYNHIGPFGVVLIQLLAYASSCCNPITYCFMNRKFRNAFIKVFQCSNVRAVKKTGPQILGRGSDMSANDSLIYGAAPSTLNKSVLVLECENRV